MKKKTKRLMALMLSFMMILGCIPSNIAHAESDDLKFTFGKNSYVLNEKVPTGDCIVSENAESVISNINPSVHKINGNTYAQVATENFEESGVYCFMLEVDFNNIEDLSINLDMYTFSFNEETLYLEDSMPSASSITKSTRAYILDGNIKIFYGFEVTEPINRVDITSSGVLATNIQTVKYEVADSANYTLNDDPSTGWYKDGNFTEPHDFATSAVPAYKKLKIVPKTGYKFHTIPDVYVDEFPISRNISINADGELLVDREMYVVQGYVSLNFEKPTTYSDYLTLKGDRSKFTMDGKDLDTEGGFDAIEATQITSNANDKGYCYLVFTYTFDTEQKLDKVPNFHFRGTNPVIQDGISPNTLLNMNVGDVYVYKVKGDKYQIIVYEKYDFRKTATITMPITVGKTIQELRDSATLETTASTDTCSFKTRPDSKRLIHLYDITDGLQNAIELVDDSYVIESNKEYFVEISIVDIEKLAYSSIKVNNTILTYYPINDNEQFNNHFRPNNTTDTIYLFYKFSTKQSSGGSKKYKADDKDTAEKISGSGKKGSKRIITPEPNRKVESIIVTDKDGNEIDVTMNEDGTYSFKQPASNVNIEVTYKNREITLTIGSTKADIDGEESNLGVCPVIRNDRTMLPIRFIAENLGAKVEWSEKNPNYVAITRGDTKIEITLGSDIMKVNGKDVKLDSVAFSENNRTYLPVRAISEALDAIVEWNEAKPMEVKIYERQ